MQVDGVPALDVGKQILVPLNAQVGVVPPLQQQRRATEAERLLDLPEDDLLGEDVPTRVTRAAVKGTEIAVGHAEVGVVDVSIDDERDTRSNHATG